jgi:hypothetical protein
MLAFISGGGGPVSRRWKRLGGGRGPMPLGGPVRGGRGGPPGV